VQTEAAPGCRRARAVTPLLDCLTGGAGDGGDAVRGGGVQDPGRQPSRSCTSAPDGRIRRGRWHCACGCSAIPGDP